MFEYDDKDTNQDQPATDAGYDANDQVVAWQSPDYEIREKSFWWYSGLFLIAVLAIAMIAWFQGISIVTASEVIAILVIVISLVIVANRKSPRINYSINQFVLTVNGKNYVLDSFKSFSLATGYGGGEEINLIPNADYSPTLNLRLDDATKQQVFDIISEAVPYEQQSQSLVENISSKLGL